MRGKKMFAALVASCILCSAAAQKIAGVKITVHAPLVKPGTGEVITFTDSMVRYTLGDLTLYQIPIEEFPAADAQGVNSDQSISSVKSTPYWYFLHKKNNQRGFMMLLPNLALAIPMSVDSFLASKANLDKSYEWILTMEASASTTAGDTIIKKYVSQAEDSGSADSVFLYFSKQIDFSLVTVIPREEPQLFRMEILLSEPKRKWLFEAEKATVNIKELKQYFSLLQ